MCKYCKFRMIEGQAVEKPDRCDWIEAHSSKGCSEVSHYLVTYGHVAEHLCSVHTQGEQISPTEPLIGDQNTRFLTIEAGADVCDFFDPLVPGSECNLPATFAKFVHMNEALCLQHATELGYNPD